MSDNTITIRTDDDGTPIKLCIDCHRRTGFGEYAGHRPCPICAGREALLSPSALLDEAESLSLAPGGIE